MNLDKIKSEMNMGEKIKDARERKEILRSELAEFAVVSDYTIGIKDNDCVG